MLIIKGIQLGLESTVEKHSETLDRNVPWRKHMAISHLPKYLCVEVSDSCGMGASSCDSTGSRCRTRRKAAWRVRSCAQWSSRSDLT